MSTEQFESQYPKSSWEGVIGQIIDVVNRGQSCQLLGLPGAGRYLVLGLLAYNKAVREHHLGEKQKQYQFVYFDFSEVRGRPLSDVMKMMFLALADSLRDRGFQEEYEMVNTLLKNAISIGDELVLTEELKHAVEQLVSQNDMKIIYLLDRVEDFIPQAESTFFANLRILRNRAKYHFSAVFALNKPLEELLEPQILEDFSDLMVGNTVYMPLVDIPSVDFRIAHLQKLTGKTLPKDVISELLRLTGGHGKLMRMASESYLANFRHPELGSGSQSKKMPKQVRHDSVKDLDQFLLTQDIVKSALDEIWLSFSPYEQQYLLSPDVKTAEKTKAQEYLQKVHFLKGDSFEIPLFSGYLTNISKEHASIQTIAYDSQTQDITKGELVLSDDLTSSEYVLLRFLVVHPDRVVTRDELISVVWGENKSTVGVTDQALDQLLFRLRQKIEEDPSNPTHIITIKGRGFKFTP